MNKSTTLQTIISKQAITLSSTQTIACALETMHEHSISSIIILDANKRPIGIFTEHDALYVISQKISIEEALSTIMSNNPFCVEESMFIHDAFIIMEEKKFRHLIVVDKAGIFSGVVTEGDFLRHLGFENLSTIQFVQDVMSVSPITLEHTHTLTQAVTLMQEHHSDYAIILKDTLPIGILTQRDIVEHYSRIISKKAYTLGEIIQHDVKMIDKATSLQEAAHLMEQHGTHQLIVIDANKNLVGLLTRHDILHAAHGAYFEFLIEIINKKSDTIESINAKHDEMIKYHELIEKSEAKLRTLFNIFPYGVSIIDMTNGHAIDFNAIAHNQIGYTAEEFKKLTILDYDANEDKEAKQQHLEKIKREGHDTFRTKFRHKNGSLIDIEVNIMYITLLDSPIFMAVTRDVTEFIKDSMLKKSRNKAFEEQSIFLHTILNTIPDLIWLKDMQGNYLACNQKFEKFYNAKESEIVGKTDFDFIDTDMAQSFRENDFQAIQVGGIHKNEEYLSFGDGSYEGYFETTKMPMIDKNNNYIGVLGVAHDISERKQKDQELAKVQALSRIGTWEWNIADNLFIGSDEAHRIFDIPIGIPQSMQEVINRVHPEDQQQHQGKLLKSLQEKKFSEIMYRIITKDNKTRWLKSYAEFILDSKGEAYKAVGVIQDITEHIEYNKELERLINYDTLTGLANRIQLLRHIVSSIENAKRHKKTLALIIFDLDRFKDVNDSFGHSTGDELLQEVSKRFAARLREGDFIARLGGDEFALVMQNFPHPEDAGVLANEMIKILTQEYQLKSSALVHIGASAGISIYPNHGESAEILLQNADAALYKAKEGGRGIYSYYTDELTNSARNRVDLASRLRRAISNNEFVVYYQPQVHIATDRIIGAEALIRWNDPQEGIISPDTFIPIAEETGLINEIGEWILNDVCRQGKIWLDKGYRLTLAVNVSANQIRHQDIPKMVQKALDTHDYKAENLELEITESALMQREEEAVLMFHQLRAMGIRLAIDDFGTGYSSLSYLKRFPIDVLKIDKSFVDDLPFERDDMAIVTAIIAMGTALGFQILAEGTERIEQIDFLQERGCTLYQGYYKSKPIPAEEFEKLLLANQK